MLVILFIVSALALCSLVICFKCEDTQRKKILSIYLTPNQHQHLKHLMNSMNHEYLNELLLDAVFVYSTVCLLKEAGWECKAINPETGEIITIETVKEKMED